MNIFTDKKFKFFIVLIVVGLFSMNVFAQVPPNDDPCGAISLTPTASCTYTTYTNVDASDSQAPGIPNPFPFIGCGPYSGSDVWFKTTVPPGATSMVIDTKNVTMTDGAMTIYTATGTCPTLTLTQLACADDGSSNPGMPLLTVTQPAGTVLYIRIYGVGGELGTFGICATANVPPVNDNCANAIPLSVNPDYNCGIVLNGQTTINATQSPNTAATCSPTGTNDDVWYSFVATGTDHRISLLSLLPATATMAIAVYDGACTGVIPPSCINGSIYTLGGLTPGTNYLVRVYTQSAVTTTNASFSICVGTLPPPPPNDNCPGAITLAVNPTLTCTTVTSGTTQSATLSAVIPDPSCGNLNAWNDDVWFSFTATSSIHRLTLSNILPAATNMVVEVYAGNCFGFVPVLCGTTPTTSMILTGLIPGSVYYARVFTNTATATVVANFDICVTTPPPPPINDECIVAIPLTVNATLVCIATTNGTTQSGTQSVFNPVPSCGVSNANNDDVWFSFIATSTTHLISLPTVTPSGTGMVIVAYTGSCASLFEIGCSTTSPLGLFGLTIGNTYFVRLFTNSSGPLIFSDFTICVTTPPPPPSNDECIGAITLPINPDYACALTVAGSTTNATPSTTAPTPTCAATGFNDDVWFSFVATGPTHRIVFSNIVGTASTLTKVVYSGSCSALTQIACTATNLFNVNGLSAGSTYYVRVFTTSTSILESAQFTVCVGSPPPPPLNDNCTGAVDLAVNPNLLCGAFTSGTVTSATASSGFPIPSCSPTGVDDDVWFKFIANAPTHRITLTNVTPITGMTMVVYSGNCAAPVEIFCNSTGLFNVSGLIVGQTYFVRVYSTGTTPNLEVDFRICVGTLPPPPTNDECTGAISLPISPNLTCSNPTAGTTLGATLSANLPVPTCGGANGWNDDVWYSIVATSTSHRISLTNITGSTNALVTTVYSGTCGSLTLLTCNTANAFDATNLTIGNTYYIRIHTSVNTFEDASFNICIGSPAPNITCSTSIPFCNQISNEINFVSTQGITVGGPISCLGTTPNRNWFDIVVVTAGPIFIQISQTGGNVSNDVDFAAWGPFATPSDACTAITAGASTVANIPNTVPTATHIQGGCSYSAAAIEYFKIPNALPGQVYKLLVTNYSTSNNNLPPFTTPSQFVKLKSMIPISSGGATLDCNVPCFSASASNNGPVCGAGTFNLTSTGSTTPFNWTGPNGFTSSLQNPTGIVAPLAPGNYIYTVTIGTGSGACVKSTTLVVGNASSAPVVAATQPIYCEGATNAAPLTATATAGNTLLWYTVATGGIGTATLTPNTTATTTYYVSQITAGGCEGPRTPLTITITPTPAAPVVTTPAPYCENETALPLSATATAGNSILYYTTATGNTGLTTLTPSTITAGTTTYYASQVTANNCEGPRAPITVIVKPRPIAPTTTAQVFCEGATVGPLTAGGLVPGASLLWYTAVIGGTAIPTPTPNNMVNSTYYVSQILNGCESPRTALTTTITPTPAGPVVSATQSVYCEGATNAAPLTATATAGNTLLWYTVATGGTGTATLTPNTTATTTYYVSQITAGGCEGPRTPLTITITPTPAAPVVTTPAPYCENEIAVPLSATATAGNSILYYTTATGGTGVTTLTPSTTTAGTTTYYASQLTANNCEGPRSPITVIVKPRPAAPTTVDLVFCEGATVGPLTAGGLLPGATLLWYTTATGGTAIPTPTPSNTASSTYYVSQILNGCESPRTALTTTITPTPTAPVVVSPIQLCPNEVTRPLSASFTQGNSLLWYTSLTGGSGNPTAPTPSTLVQGTFNFYVSQVTSNGCESPRSNIKVTVSNNNLFVNAGSDTTLCEGRRVKLLPTVSSPLATFQWRALNVPINTIDSIFIKNASVKPVDTAIYVVKALLNGCSVEDTINVNVIWKPVIDAGKNISICTNDSVLIMGSVSHISNSNVNFLWTSNGSDTLNSPSQLQTYAHPVRRTFYTLTATTDSLIYGCDFKVYDSMFVAIQPIVKAFAGKDTIAAKGVSHQLHGSGGTNYIWSSPSGINISNAFSQNAYVKLNDDANFYLEVSDPIGCKGYDSIFVKVYNGNTYYVPNSFTPNGDGLNDIFRAIPVGMSNTVYFRIFNRLGELIFETNQYLKGWDGTYKGKPQPNGVYVWMVGGTDRDNIKISMQGTVMLIR